MYLKTQEGVSTQMTRVNFRFNLISTALIYVALYLAIIKSMNAVMLCYCAVQGQDQAIASTTDFLEW